MIVIGCGLVIMLCVLGLFNEFLRSMDWEDTL
jgi:hypothetical protein